MEWKIDTSVKGEVAVKDLRSTLEASRDHFLTTQADLAARSITDAVHNPKEPGAPPVDFVAVGKAADAVRAKHVAKQADLKDQIEAGIVAACALADVLGGTVACTVSGHHDPRHRSMCPQRILVAVDRMLDG